MSKGKKNTHKQDKQARLGRSLSLSPPFLVFLGLSIIVIAAFLAYFPSLSGGFILDDDGLVTQSELIKAPDGLYRFWCTTESIDYWPVTNTTFWIEWRLWEMNATGYRVTNLVLHIIEALLIWIILRKLSIPGAFWAAMIFAVHPVNVESVAWISSRKNLMAMLFFLLSILCYLKFHTRAHLRFAAKQTPPTAYSPLPTFSSFILHPSSFCLWYWLSLGAFVLAMLSKGSVAVLPVLLLVIIWWLRPLSWFDLLKTAPFFIVAVVLSAVNVWFQTHGSGEAYRNAGFIERLLGAGGVVWFYLYKAVVPIELVFVYPQWEIKAGNPLWWLPLLAASAVTIVLWLYRKSWGRPFWFAWVFFCVSLGPVMGFADVGFMQYSLVADHYQHIAIIGVIALSAAGWSTWRDRLWRKSYRAATVVAIAAMVALTFLTWRQSGLYHDELTLFRATLEKNPDCWMAYNNLGSELLDSGKIQEAMDYFQQALKLKPDHVKAHYNMGNALLRTGRPQEAIAYYEKALAIQPDYPEVCNNLGNAFKEVGQYQRAIKSYTQAVELKPDFAEAHYNLSVILVQTGQPRAAIEECRRALELNPDFTEAYYNLAYAHAAMRQSAEAIATGQKALELARSKQQTELAEKIDIWLKSYRASLSNRSKMQPDSKSALPTQ